MSMVFGLWAAYEVRLGVILGRLCAESGPQITLVSFKSHILMSTRLIARTGWLCTYTDCPYRTSDHPDTSYI